MSCLLLSGKVEVLASKLNKLTNREIRLDQTRNSFYEIIKLKLFDKIVISDASNVEIFSVKEIQNIIDKNNIIIEQITFDNKNIQDKNGGIKSINELSNIKNTIKLSSLLKHESSFYKITPRYEIANLSSIVNNSQTFQNLFYDYHFYPFSKYKRIIKTNFFKTDSSFFENIDINSASNILDDNNEYYLEHYFYDILSNYKRIYQEIDFPYIMTTSGTSGLPLKNRFYDIRNKMSKYGYMAFSV